MKIRQEGNIYDYQDKFEDLRVRNENGEDVTELQESSFLSGFIGGLRHEIRPVMRMITLVHAFESAKLQLIRNVLTKHWQDYQTKTNTNTSKFKPVNLTSYPSTTFKTAQLHQNFPCAPKPLNDTGENYYQVP